MQYVAVDTAEPSPMSHEIVGARPWAYLDDAPLEERRARAVAVRRALPAAEADGLGALDPAAIAEVAEQVWPVVRDPDELHDALLDLGVLPLSEGGRAAAFLEPLVAAGRAARLRSGADEWWVAAERVGLARTIAGSLTTTSTDAIATPTSTSTPTPTPTPTRTATVDPDLQPLPSERVPEDDDAAGLAVVRGWVPRVGPFTAGALASRIGLEPARVESALARLELEGLVLRGRFLPGAPWSAEAPHWCERSVLARIHRLTIGRLRKEIEPASAADLVRFLARWQHVAPGTRLHGARGLAEVIGQLQGFHAAAGAWERDLLAARVAGYERALLDELCLGGEVAWGRLAVVAGADEVPRRRNAPTRNAPVTLALRADLPWLLAAAAGAPPPLGPSARALVEVLARRGASFLPELAAATGRLPGELEQALWELVSAGYVTCDGFAGLRALIEPPQRGRPVRRPPAAGGRWSLLRGEAPAAGEGEVLERAAAQYLRRYGVVFRDLLARETAPPPWRELLRVYRALEARGAIRGGRFVAGFTGEQFALPEAVDALRAVRRAPREGSERVEVSAADPLNLVGIVTPGARVPAVLGQRVALIDGVPVPGSETGRAARARSA